MGWSLQHIFLTPPIMGVTINTVFLSPAFRFYFYIFIGVTLSVGMVVYLRRKSSFAFALKKSIVACFFASGLVYAVHADIGWTTWLIADSVTYAGKTTEGKLRSMEGPFYDFVLLARRAMPGDYMLPNDASDNYLTRRFQYFMLPQRKRPDAQYIVVLADSEAKFDRAARTYMRRDQVIRDVEPVLLFTRDGYILKKLR